MTIREIVTLPHPVLRRKARPVTEYGPEFQTLVDDMIETMRAAPGVGLAAPQVGVSLRLVVVEYAVNDEEEDSPKKLYVLANPEWKLQSEEKEIAIEGCLSIPGLQGEVERSLAVVVKGFNRRGQRTTIKAQGWLARIFQHEIDHLEGIVYPDRAVRVWKPDPQEPVLDNV